METETYTPPLVVPGSYTPATMPNAATYPRMFAWDTTYNAYVCSDGTQWLPPSQNVGIASYSGVTNANGDYTVTFATVKNQVPNIQPVLYPPTDPSILVRVTAVSTAGFTIKVEQRASLNVLGVNLLSFAVSNVSGQSVWVLVTDR